MQKQTRLGRSTGITLTKSKRTIQQEYSVASSGNDYIIQPRTASLRLHPKERNQDVRRRQVGERIQEPGRGSAPILHAEESGQQDHHWLERWQRKVAKRMNPMIFLVSNKSISTIINSPSLLLSQIIHHLPTQNPSINPTKV